MQITLLAGSLLLQLNNSTDVLVFQLGIFLILTGVTTQACEDISCFRPPADFGEPAGTLREEEADGEEEQEREDLEGDGETPDEA